MAKKQSAKGKRRVPKTVLRLPDLDQAKSAVLNSLQFDRRSTRVQARDRGIHRMALFGAATLLQQDRCPPVSYTRNLGIWRLAPSICG